VYVYFNYKESFYYETCILTEALIRVFYAILDKSTSS